jgi:hypothetical protein
MRTRGVRLTSSCSALSGVLPGLVGNSYVVLISVRARRKPQPALRLGDYISTAAQTCISAPFCVVFAVSCRCNTAGKIGFVSDPRRLNVAITRPRRGLVVVCSPDTLSRGSSDWAAFVDCCEEKGWMAGPQQLPTAPWQQEGVDPFAAKPADSSSSSSNSSSSDSEELVVSSRAGGVRAGGSSGGRARVQWQGAGVAVDSLGSV